MQSNKTKLMGILNVTPDSFSDGGQYYKSTQKAVKRAEEMIAEGVDIIDIGGESTRPGSEKIDAKEELKRVLPVIKAIKQKFPQAKLSIDTWKSEVAEEAVNAGCTIINSLGGFTFDQKLAQVVRDTNTQIMIYHIKGTPKTMQQEITNDDIIADIADFFRQQIALGKKYGIKTDQVILDPGIGFGKNVSQNLAILKHLKSFLRFKLPVAIGVSRKSHLEQIFKAELKRETSPLERLEGSLAETAIAVQNGASIIRTHDVLQTRKFLTVFEKCL